MKVSACKQCFKYLMVDKDGVIEMMSQAWFLYADDVCLMESNEQDLQMFLIAFVDALANMVWKLVKTKVKCGLYKWSEGR